MKEKQLILKGQADQVRLVAVGLEDLGLRVEQEWSVEPDAGYGMAIEPELVVDLMVALLGSGALVSAICGAFQRKLKLKIEKKKKTVEITFVNVKMDDIKEILRELKEVLGK